MIHFKNKNQSDPYIKFFNLYDLAFKKSQDSIESFVISSFDNSLKQPEARFVNIKLIDDENWIFYSNYNSPKATQFSDNNKITALTYWSTIKCQIRIKAEISKVPSEISDVYFSKRSAKKNALAISSDQSKVISSYEMVQQNYKSQLKKHSTITPRPKYWGGFSFTPYYFEFWAGHSSRVNKRESFQLEKNNWRKKVLQP